MVGFVRLVHTSEKSLFVNFKKNFLSFVIFEDLPKYLCKSFEID
jgi:hypothetical protein